MNHSDIAALMKGAAPVIRDYVAGAVQPLLLQIEAMRKEIDALKAKQVDPDDVDSRLKALSTLLKENRQTASAENEARQIAIDELKTVVLAECEALVTEKIADLPVPKDGRDGKDADVEEIAALAAASILPDIMDVRKMVEALPAPIELPDIPAMIAEAVDESKAWMDAEIGSRIDEAVAALPPAEKGKDADPVEVAAQIAREVERAVAALPVPKDGQSITLDDVQPLIDEAVTKAVTLIPVPKDGTDGKDGRNGLDAVKFFRDANGHLIVVKSDGSTDDLGEYVGKDGAPGERGKDGADGVGFDDMEFHYDGERTATFRFVKGDRIREEKISLPVMLYRGIFREGESYKQGDVCTWGGHVWHCDTDTNDKPDGKERCWTMAMRKARDGKDGMIKPVVKSGPVKVG